MLLVIAFYWNHYMTWMEEKWYFECDFVCMKRMKRNNNTTAIWSSIDAIHRSWKCSSHLSQSIGRKHDKHVCQLCIYSQESTILLIDLAKFNVWITNPVQTVQWLCSYRYFKTVWMIGCYFFLQQTIFIPHEGTLMRLSMWNGSTNQLILY